MNVLLRPTILLLDKAALIVAVIQMELCQTLMANQTWNATVQMVNVIVKPAEVDAPVPNARICIGVIQFMENVWHVNVTVMDLNPCNAIATTELVSVVQDPVDHCVINVQG